MESVRHVNVVPSARLNDMNSSITLDFKIRHFKIKCFPARSKTAARSETGAGANIKHNPYETHEGFTTHTYSTHDQLRKKVVDNSRIA